MFHFLLIIAFLQSALATCSVPVFWNNVTNVLSFTMSSSSKFTIDGDGTEMIFSDTACDLTIAAQSCVLPEYMNFDSGSSTFMVYSNTEVNEFLISYTDLPVEGLQPDFQGGSFNGAKKMTLDIPNLQPSWDMYSITFNLDLIINTYSLNLAGTWSFKSFNLTATDAVNFPSDGKTITTQNNLTVSCNSLDGGDSILSGGNVDIKSQTYINLGQVDVASLKLNSANDVYAGFVTVSTGSLVGQSGSVDFLSVKVKGDLIYTTTSTGIMSGFATGANASARNIQVYSAGFFAPRATFYADQAVTIVCMNWRTNVGMVSPSVNITTTYSSSNTIDTNNWIVTNNTVIKSITKGITLRNTRATQNVTLQANGTITVNATQLSSLTIIPYLSTAANVIFNGSMTCNTMSIQTTGSILAISPVTVSGVATLSGPIQNFNSTSTFTANTLQATGSGTGTLSVVNLNVSSVVSVTTFANVVVSSFATGANVTITAFKLNLPSNVNLGNVTIVSSSSSLTTFTNWTCKSFDARFTSGADVSASIVSPWTKITAAHNIFVNVTASDYLELYSENDDIVTGSLNSTTMILSASSSSVTINGNVKCSVFQLRDTQNFYVQGDFACTTFNGDVGQGFTFGGNVNVNAFSFTFQTLSSVNGNWFSTGGVSLDGSMGPTGLIMRGTNFTSQGSFTFDGISLDIGYTNCIVSSIWSSTVALTGPVCTNLQIDSTSTQWNKLTGNLKNLYMVSGTYGDVTLPNVPGMVWMLGNLTGSTGTNMATFNSFTTVTNVTSWNVSVYNSQSDSMTISTGSTDWSTVTLNPMVKIGNPIGNTMALATGSRSGQLAVNQGQVGNAVWNVGYPDASTMNLAFSLAPFTNLTMVGTDMYITLADNNCTLTFTYNFGLVIISTGNPVVVNGTLPDTVSTNTNDVTFSIGVKVNNLIITGPSSNYTVTFASRNYPKFANLTILTFPTVDIILPGSTTWEGPWKIQSKSITAATGVSFPDLDLTTGTISSVGTFTVLNSLNILASGSVTFSTLSVVNLVVDYSVASQDLTISTLSGTNNANLGVTIPIGTGTISTLTNVGNLRFNCASITLPNTFTVQTFNGITSSNCVFVSGSGTWTFQNGSLTCGSGFVMTRTLNVAGFFHGKSNAILNLNSPVKIASLNLTASSTIRVNDTLTVGSLLVNAGSFAALGSTTNITGNANITVTNAISFQNLVNLGGNANMLSTSSTISIISSMISSGNWTLKAFGSCTLYNVTLDSLTIDSTDIFVKQLVTRGPFILASTADTSFTGQDFVHVQGDFKALGSLVWGVNDCMFLGNVSTLSVSPSETIALCQRFQAYPSTKNFESLVGNQLYLAQGIYESVVVPSLPDGVSLNLGTWNGIGPTNVSIGNFMVNGPCNWTVGLYADLNRTDTLYVGNSVNWTSTTLMPNLNGTATKFGPMVFYYGDHSGEFVNSLFNLSGDLYNVQYHPSQIQLGMVELTNLTVVDGNVNIDIVAGNLAYLTVDSGNWVVNTGQTINVVGTLPASVSVSGQNVTIAAGAVDIDLLTIGGAGVKGLIVSEATYPKVANMTRFEFPNANLGFNVTTSWNQPLQIVAGSWYDSGDATMVSLSLTSNGMVTAASLTVGEDLSILANGKVVVDGVTAGSFVVDYSSTGNDLTLGSLNANFVNLGANIQVWTCKLNDVGTVGTLKLNASGVIFPSTVNVDTLIASCAMCTLWSTDVSLKNGTLNMINGGYLRGFNVEGSFNLTSEGVMKFTQTPNIGNFVFSSTNNLEFDQGANFGNADLNVGGYFTAASLNVTGTLKLVSSGYVTVQDILGLGSGTISAGESVNLAGNFTGDNVGLVSGSGMVLNGTWNVARLSVSSIGNVVYSGNVVSTGNVNMTSEGDLYLAGNILNVQGDLTLDASTLHMNVEKCLLTGSFSGASTTSGTLCNKMQVYPSSQGQWQNIVGSNLYLASGSYNYNVKIPSGWNSNGVNLTFGTWDTMGPFEVTMTGYNASSSCQWNLGIYGNLNATDVLNVNNPAALSTTKVNAVLVNGTLGNGPFVFYNGAHSSTFANGQSINVTNKQFDLVYGDSSIMMKEPVEPISTTSISSTEETTTSFSSVETTSFSSSMETTTSFSSAVETTSFSSSASFSSSIETTSSFSSSLSSSNSAISSTTVLSTSTVLSSSASPSTSVISTSSSSKMPTSSLIISSSSSTIFSSSSTILVSSSTILSSSSIIPSSSKTTSTTSRTTSTSQTTSSTTTTSKTTTSTSTTSHTSMTTSISYSSVASLNLAVAPGVAVTAVLSASPLAVPTTSVVKPVTASPATTVPGQTATPQVVVQVPFASSANRFVAAQLNGFTFSTKTLGTKVGIVNGAWNVVNQGLYKMGAKVDLDANGLSGTVWVWLSNMPVGTSVSLSTDLKLWTLVGGVKREVTYGYIIASNNATVQAKSPVTTTSSRRSSSSTRKSSRSSTRTTTRPVTTTTTSAKITNIVLAEFCAKGKHYNNPKNCCCAPPKTIYKTIGKRQEWKRDNATEDVMMQHLCPMCPSRSPSKKMWCCNKRRTVTIG